LNVKMKIRIEWDLILFYIEKNWSKNYSDETKY